MLFLRKRNGRPVATDGLAEARALCLQAEKALENASRKRVVQMAVAMTGMEDGWCGQIENDLARDWDSFKGASRLSWDKAKDATRDAWQRASDRIDTAIGTRSSK